MSKQFRLVQASFAEPAELYGADLLGRIDLKPGTQFFGASKLAIAVAGKEHTYELSFTVAEPTDGADSVTHDVVLVSDLLGFSFDGSALLLGELRGLGNSGGYVFLLSDSQPIELFPALATGEVRIYDANATG